MSAARPLLIPFVLALLLPGCTFFVRIAGGPSLDTEGNHGGVIALSIGGGMGSTRTIGPSPTYEQGFGVGPRHGALDKTLGVTLRGYGSFGDSARFGLGGHIGLLFGREPRVYRGHAGFTVGAGLRLKLAGVTGSVVMGSCGPVNDGDAWGVFLFQDVTYDLVIGDAGRLGRVSFPVGIEFRINSTPEFPRRSRRWERPVPEDEAVEVPEHPSTDAPPEESAPTMP